MLQHSLLSSQGWSSFTTGASKFASAAKEGVSNWVHAVYHWPRVLGEGSQGPSTHWSSPFQQTSMGLVYCRMAQEPLL